MCIRDSTITEKLGDEMYEHGLREDLMEELMEKRTMAQKSRDGRLESDEGFLGEGPSQHEMDIGPDAMCNGEFLGEEPSKNEKDARPDAMCDEKTWRGLRKIILLKTIEDY